MCQHTQVVCICTYVYDGYGRMHVFSVSNFSAKCIHFAGLHFLCTYLSPLRTQSACSVELGVSGSFPHVCNSPHVLGSFPHVRNSPHVLGSFPHVCNSPHIFESFPHVCNSPHVLGSFPHVCNSPHVLGSFPHVCNSPTTHSWVISTCVQLTPRSGSACSESVSS